MKKKTTKLEKGHEVSKVERTGDKTVVIHHDNGDTFEGVVDTDKINFAEDSRKTASRFHIPQGKVGIKNVMSNEDRRRLKMPQDPELEDYIE